MPGGLSHLTMPMLAHTVGVKMALLVFPTLMLSSVSPLLSGTRRSEFGQESITLDMDTNRYPYSDFLKERLFGLGNPEGNHGESIKDVHFYIDNTPTHSYMKYLYKYPQKKFPYEEIRRINAERGFLDDEYNMMDTDLFE